MMAGPHDYFEMLMARSDVFRAFSLRPRVGHTQSSPYYEHQLKQPNEGGYAEGNGPLWITFDPADPYDAARVVVPPFHPDYVSGTGLVAAPLTADDNKVSLTGATTGKYNVKGRSYLMGSEIVTNYDPDGGGPLKVFDATTGIMYIKRGQFGTTPAAHTVGVPCQPSTNTVPNCIKAPFGSVDGHDYFITWDCYWTDTFLDCGFSNHKAFNLLSDGIWFETNAAYAGGSGDAEPPDFDQATMIAAFMMRTYNALGGPDVWTPEVDKGLGLCGPEVTKQQPMSPQLNPFIIMPNRWTRVFVGIQQRLEDYDLAHVWVADEQHDPVEIHRGVRLAVRLGTIEQFVVQFNSSTDELTRGGARDLIAYVRNIAILQDPGDVRSLLVKPGGTVPPIPTKPRPPGKPTMME